MVILMDDEDRENEGDLIMAASKVTTESVAFMARYACGLICMPMSQQRCQQLQLPLMVQDNRASHNTNFTVSVEAREGVTTGISAADRAHTIQVAAANHAKPEDIVQPGHIFPIMAQPGGVLSRAGHTEASCDLAMLAGLEPAAVIVEIMNEDGTMARRPELEQFSRQHNLKIGTIADLIQYRMLNEQTVTRIRQQSLSTQFGEFDIYVYQDGVDGELHLALVKGDIQPDQLTLVRVTQADTMRDLLHSTASGFKSWSIYNTLARINEEGRGVLVLIAHQERADDILDRLGWLVSTEDNKPTPNQPLGSAVVRTVGAGSQILRDIGVGKMRLLSSQVKYNAISGFGLEVVEYLPCE